MIKSLITNGRLSNTAADTLRRAIASFEGKWVEIVVKRPKRSLKQNAAWFTILEEDVVPPFRRNGSNWDAWTIHEMIVKELGYTEVLVDPKGNLYCKRLHTSDFEVDTFEEFAERARAHIAEKYGIYMSHPNEHLEPPCY